MQICRDDERERIWLRWPRKEAVGCRRPSLVGLVAFGDSLTSFEPMIRIAISRAAFDATASLCCSGPSPTSPKPTPTASATSGLSPNVVNRLRALRGPGGSYSDVILRLAALRASLAQIEYPGAPS